jgi:asparagine synthase (glutamine-hydrolysing)
VAAIAAESGRRLHTYSITVPGHANDEGPAAAQVARHLDCPHTSVVWDDTLAGEALESLVSWMDEPNSDPALLATWYLSRRARETLVVALAGDGGDEALGGYGVYLAQVLAAGLPADVSPAEAVARLRAVAGDRFSLRRFVTGLGQPLPLRQMFWHDGLDPVMLNALYPPAASLWTALTDPWTTWDASGTARDPAERSMQLDVRFYLGDQLLPKLDVASMAWGLEVRSPWLDPALQGWMATLPPSLKGPYRPGKALLQAMMADRLPEAILRREKQGFDFPLGQWLNGVMRGQVEASLDPGALRRTGMFRLEAVSRLWDEHRSGTCSQTQAIWRVMVLQRWLDHWGVCR